MSQLQAVSEQLNVFADLDEKEQIFQQFAQDLCNQLFVLMRSSGLYDLENKALEQPYQILIKTIKNLYDFVKSPIQLRMNEGHFFVNRKQVKVNFSTYQNTRYLKKIFTHLDINEIQFDPEIQQSDLTLFLQTFVKVLKERGLQINQAVIPHIKIRTLNLGEVHELSKSKHPLDQIAVFYASMRSHVTDFYEDLKQDRTPEHALLKRILLTLIEMPHNSIPWLTCSEYLREKDEFTLIDQTIEATNFCAALAATLHLDANIRLTLLSACIQVFQGWTLLPDSIHTAIDLYDTTGSSKLFNGLQLDHKKLTRIRNEIINHLLASSGMNEAMIQKLILVYESQRNPKQNKQKQTTTTLKLLLPSHSKLQAQLYQSGLTESFLSDLICLSHYYTYLKQVHDPVQALELIKKTSFSPFLIDLIEQMLGQYPIATCVNLSDGRQGIITSFYTDHSCLVKVVIPQASNTQRLQIKDELHIRSTSPIQITGVCKKYTRIQLAPVIFSHHSFPL